MKKRLFLLPLVAALLGAGSAAAQVVTVTAGTDGSALSPFNHTKANCAYEVIYTQAQLKQAGTIERLALEKNSGSNQDSIDHVVLYLKPTTETIFTSGKLDTTGYTRVYAGKFPNKGTTGYQEVKLQKPYVYDNVSNLSLLVLRKNGTAAASGTGSSWNYAFQGTKNTVCRRNTAGDAIAQGGTTLTAYDVLVNLRLTFATITATHGRATLLADVYPNPATTACRVQLPSAQPATYALTDALGREVRPSTRLALSPAGLAELPLTGLPAGVYLLRLTQASATSTLRIVKQ